MARWLSRSIGLVVVEVARQVPVGVGQLQEELGAVLEGGDGVGAAGEPGGGLVAVGELDQGVGELGGVTALQ